MSYTADHSPRDFNNTMVVSSPLPPRDTAISSFLSPLSNKVTEEFTSSTSSSNAKNLNQQSIPPHKEDMHAFSTKGGVRLPFPAKLYYMLQYFQCHEPEVAKIISWQPHGCCFMTHDIKRMEEFILPRFFNHRQYSSFRRNLNIWGFKRLTQNGPDHGSYYHELFLRGNPSLCNGIKRLGSKKMSEAAKQSRTIQGTAEPQFSLSVQSLTSTSFYPTSSNKSSTNTTKKGRDIATPSAFDASTSFQCPSTTRNETSTNTTMKGMDITTQSTLGSFDALTSLYCPTSTRNETSTNTTMKGMGNATTPSTLAAFDTSTSFYCPTSITRIESSTNTTKNQGSDIDTPATLAAADAGNLASYLSTSGDHTEALRLHQKALSLYEDAPGDTFKEAKARTYNNLGIEFENLGQYKAALEQHTQCLAIFEEMFGTSHEKTSTSYFNVGAVKRQLGDLEGALEMYQKSIAIDEKVKGKDHIDTALGYSSVGRIYMQKKDYEEASKIFNKSLRIREKCRGNKHPDVAVGLGDVGLIYHIRGDYDEAIMSHQRALDISESMLGNTHPQTGSCYQNLGGSFYEQGNWEAALDMCQKAKAAYVTSFGADHPKSVTANAWLDFVEVAIAGRTDD